jgi:hypothetical protein
MNPNQNQNETGKVCKCGSHRKIMPLAIALVALDVLLANLGAWSWYTANIIWPIIVIIAACAKMSGCKSCKCQDK